MADKLWVVELDDVSHRITWRYDGLLARGRLCLDGQVLDLHSMTPVHPLRNSARGYTAEFNDHLLTVFVYPEKTRKYDELFVDGRSMDTGKHLLEDSPPHYRTLGIPIYAEAQHIHRAHQKWQNLFADPRAQSSPEVIARIAAIRENVEAAYAVLSDPRQRAAYDAQYPEAAHLRRRNTQFLWFVAISGTLLVCLVLVFILLTVYGSRLPFILP